MLSIAKIKTAGGASKYYAKDNYYSKEEDQDFSRWFGAGADALGLQGMVDPAQFKALMEGHLPNGVELGRMDADGKLEHTPGWDLTFSAPKSVSIMALVGRDSRLLEAHERAVNVALSYLEDHAAFTRVMRDGEKSLEQTNSFVAALFTHDTTRSLDPGLHTHAIILNATQREDGQWRSLDSQTIYDLKMLGGAIYRSELARDARDLGYEVSQTHSDGRFELTVVPQALVREQSQRRQEIEKELENSHVKDAKTAARVAIITRELKKDVDREVLVDVWKDQAREHSFDVSAAIPQPVVAQQRDVEWLDTLAKGETRLSPVSLGQGLRAADDQRRADEAVKYAADKLAERDAVFITHDLIKEAITGAIGPVGYAPIEAAVKRAVEQKNLIPALLRDRPAWTTPEALKLETENIELIGAGRGAVESILPDSATAKSMLGGKGLTPGQFDAAHLILTSTDRYVAVQGFAGTGKTFMLNAVRELSGLKLIDVVRNENDKTPETTLLGAAPSSAAANLIKDDAKIDSMSVAKLLAVLNRDMRQARANGESLRRDGEVWLIDESSMVSTRAANDLIKKAKQTGARVVFVGDPHQLPSPEAGKFFAQILESGKIQFSRMADIVRQTQEKAPALRAAVYDMYRKHEREIVERVTGVKDKRLGVVTAFMRLQDRVVEIPRDSVLTHNKAGAKALDGNEGLLNEVASEYLKLSAENRAHTLIAIPTNSDRVVVNEVIRDGLVKEGLIAADGLSVHTNMLEARGYTPTETTRAKNYLSGDVVKFNRDLKRLQVGANEYWRVIKTDASVNLVQLKNDDGRTIDWFPNREGGGRKNGVTVYEVQKRVLSAGDRLVWRLNDEKSGRFNAELASVVSVSPADQTATIRMKDGSLSTLDLTKRKDHHWDYAYARTVHALQGATEKNAFLVVQSWRRNATNFKSVLVQLSRAKENVRIFTDNFLESARVLDTPERSGDKASARDGVREFEKRLNKEAAKAVERAKKMEEKAQKQREQTLRKDKENRNAATKSKEPLSSKLLKERRVLDADGLVKSPDIVPGGKVPRSNVDRSLNKGDKSFER